LHAERAIARQLGGELRNLPRIELFQVWPNPLNRPMTVKDHTCVVIAAYNEAVTIGRVVTEVRRAGYPVVVVDDGSKDTTAQVAKASGATVMQHPFNLGQGAALQTGIDLALANGAEVIVTFDADGQHGAADISRLAEALNEEKVDFVLGSRFLAASSTFLPLRRLLVQAATLSARLHHWASTDRRPQRTSAHDPPRR